MRTATAELVLKTATAVLQDFVDGKEIDELTLEWASTLAIANLCRRPVPERKITRSPERDEVRRILKEANHG